MNKILLAALAALLTLLVILSACQLTGLAVKDGDSCFGLRPAARDQCYAEQRKCSKIGNPDVRDSCVVELAKTKVDATVCDLIKGEQAQGFCLEQLALMQNNEGLCANISVDYWRDNCHYHLGVNNREEDWCVRIGDQKQKQDCFQEVALATGNAPLCDELEERERRGCLVKIAVSSRDISLCSRMDTPLASDACRLKVAKETRQRLFCDSIRYSSIKQMCYADFEEN